MIYRKMDGWIDRKIDNEFFIKLFHLEKYRFFHPTFLLLRYSFGFILLEVMDGSWVLFSKKSFYGKLKKLDNPISITQMIEIGYISMKVKKS